MARWSVETLNDTVDRELDALPADMRARFVRIGELIAEQAADLLNELRGVSFPTASVFLTAWDPCAFGIMDARTWRALRTLTGVPAFDRGRRTLFRREEFRLYTHLLRRWSTTERGISPRLIDKALWQYDKDLGHGSGRRRDRSRAPARTQPA